MRVACRADMNIDGVREMVVWRVRLQDMGGWMGWSNRGVKEEG